MFSKEQVRQRKLAHFLRAFDPAALPEGPALAAMMGTFQFLVDGWNDDPNELYAITEIRKFYQHFHQVWPYWFFFCDLHTETLQMMTLCLLPNLHGFKRLGEPNAAAEYDPMDLINFIINNFGPLNLMMERAGMSEMDIDTDKTGIASRGADLGIDFTETWSCYKGGETHCGVCGTCVERREAFLLAGVLDPTAYLQTPPLPVAPAIA